MSAGGQGGSLDAARAGACVRPLDTYTQHGHSSHGMSSSLSECLHWTCDLTMWHRSSTHDVEFGSACEPASAQAAFWCGQCRQISQNMPSLCLPTAAYPYLTATLEQAVRLVCRWDFKCCSICLTHPYHMVSLVYHNIVCTCGQQQNIPGWTGTCSFTPSSSLTTNYGWSTSTAINSGSTNGAHCPLLQRQVCCF